MQSIFILAVFVYIENDPKWVQKIANYTKKYVNEVTSWLSGTKIPTIVVRYEDMVKDTRTQLQRMLDFLKYPYTEERLDCVMKHQIETFHRKHDHQFNPFTDEQERSFVKAMKLVEPILNLYDISYKDVIDAYDDKVVN